MVAGYIPCDSGSGVKRCHVTCYQRHIHWLFEALELPYETKERRELDVALKEAVGVPADTPCNELWLEHLKPMNDDDRAALIPKVREIIR